MINIVVDSSVFVSIFGKRDSFSVVSEKFLQQIKPEFIIILPTLVVAETIVTVGKYNAEIIRTTNEILSQFNLVSLDENFLKWILGVTSFTLKTSDFIIALTAKVSKATLVTWDKQQLSSKNTLCQAITPADYLQKIEKN